MQDLPELVLAYDEATMIVTAGLPRTDAEAAELVQAILSYLGTVTAPVEEDAIRENVEGQNAARVRVLRELVKAGKVARSGEGKRGSPYLYRLPCNGAPGPTQDSGFLVPTYSLERENEKPETAGKPVSVLQNFLFPGSDQSEPAPWDTGTSISPSEDPLVAYARRVHGADFEGEAPA